MDRTDAIAWVVSVCTSYVRKSQAKTLGALVAGALAVERVSLASLGRSMLGPAAVKHQIKRAYRFLANERVEPSGFMRAIVPRVLRRWPADRPLLVSFDWTDVRGLQTLMAAAVVRGRAVPLCWASCTKHVWDGHKSRNSFEEALLLVLRDMLPPHVRPIVLADRGFGRTELGRFCQQMKISYAIRVQGKVIVRFGDQAVRLDRYPVRKGKSELLRNVLYRAEGPVRQHVVVRWKRGLPKKRDEPWYLMTDLPDLSKHWTARRISDLYAKRMTVEELFRDAKSTRNGFALRQTMIQKPDRLDRLILILAVAYLLLVGIGLIATQRCRPSAWASNTRARELSLFQIGRVMLERLNATVNACLNALAHAIQAAVPNWG